ncbi:hypothetical protein IQ255_06790 [Pleurocapsales cyanobacterium LEGE 10410]|nr:hypothetical protein [Pleurocapsales cyanobacterium LEGE 10410]
MGQSQSEPINLIEEQAALDAIANTSENVSIILDFDETLLLRNSTAEYINSLRPRLVGFILVRFLKVIQPWNWLPQPFNGYKVRDWFLVTVPTVLLPWTLLLWRRTAKKIAEDYGNIELISAANSNPKAQIIVASLGFNFIINPILRHLPIRCDRLVSCRFWRGAGDRHQGKLLMMQEVLLEKEIKSAILITDSEDDLPLLQVVRQPYFVLWSRAKYIVPFKDFGLNNLLEKLKKNARSS